MPYEELDPDGSTNLVECGHGDETFCNECGGCLDCGNCYCDDFDLEPGGTDED